MYSSINKLKKFTCEYFKGDDVQIVFFGSRSRGDESLLSDIDIGVWYREKQGLKAGLFSEAIEELNIPFKIDIVDLSKCSLDFREKVLSQGIIWKD
ncbi:MAG: nucleotidyltransferase domain-containing protein [Nitrospirae bacterium]|nr:nucleotidyltransferase domain-containing protein [Nitrospirota bacterium]